MSYDVRSVDKRRYSSYRGHFSDGCYERGDVSRSKRSRTGSEWVRRSDPPGPGGSSACCRILPRERASPSIPATPYERECRLGWRRSALARIDAAVCSPSPESSPRRRARRRVSVQNRMKPRPPARRTAPVTPSPLTPPYRVGGEGGRGRSAWTLPSSPVGSHLYGTQGTEMARGTRTSSFLTHMPGSQHVQ